MHQREKVIRTIKGEEKIEDFVFGSGILTANPPEIQDRKGYKVMRAHGFSVKMNNGKDKKPSYYALELWGDNADAMARLGFKGQLIEVCGRFTTSQYKGRDGQDKELLTLTVERFTCLSRKDKPADSEGDKPETKTTETTSNVDKPANEAPITGTQEIPSGIEEIEKEKDDEFDDLPF